MDLPTRCLGGILSYYFLHWSFRFWQDHFGKIYLGVFRCEEAIPEAGKFSDAGELA